MPSRSQCTATCPLAIELSVVTTRSSIGAATSDASALPGTITGTATRPSDSTCPSTSPAGTSITS